MKDLLTIDKPAGRIISVVSIAVIIIISLLMCNPAKAQERATLVSYEKIKFSTKYKVTVRTDSCTEFITKWDSHCWRCTDSDVPQTWDVREKSKNNYFIKPVL